MNRTNSIIIHAPLSKVFAAAADLGRWPEFLPHYRYNRFIVQTPSGGTVKMSCVHAGVPLDMAFPIPDRHGKARASLSPFASGLECDARDGSGLEIRGTARRRCAGIRDARTRTPLAGDRTAARQSHPGRILRSAHRRKDACRAEAKARSAATARRSVGGSARASRGRVASVGKKTQIEGRGRSREEESGGSEQSHRQIASGGAHGIARPDTFLEVECSGTIQGSLCLQIVANLEGQELRRKLRAAAASQDFAVEHRTCLVTACQGGHRSAIIVARSDPRGQWFLSDRA